MVLPKGRICHARFWHINIVNLICATNHIFLRRPIIAKTVRYFRIWTNYGEIPPLMSNLELFFIVFIVMAVELVMFLIYLLPGGIPNDIVTQSPTDSTYTFIACSTHPPSYGTTVIAFWLGINGFFLILAIMIQLICRRLETPYHESKFILFTVSPHLHNILNLVFRYFDSERNFNPNLLHHRYSER